MIAVERMGIADWPRWGRWVEPLLAELGRRPDHRGRQTLIDIETIKRRLAANTHQVWLGFDFAKMPIVIGVMGTAIQHYPPDQRVLEIEYCTGRGVLRAVPAGVPKLIAFSVEHGCTEINAPMRPGWVRVLKGHGFETTHVFMRLRI